MNKYFEERKSYNKYWIWKWPRSGRKYAIGFRGTTEDLQNQSSHSPVLTNKISLQISIKNTEHKLAKYS